ncbi:MAG: DUF2273 domain-containing protein [Atopobiaceae bacterium]|jgi:uncharacterized membrane protein|nr:DUF2273 domain-containing protein [Atopobiaceae bacterium]MCH4181201.1 DUF2273 domain-containing protein [Atopobiaceae bacterium]MCH4214966.1 DUF2273 domain-containing protein [Atopobiaceae bacterium]MCH4230666.1 DUF2273 domain-containing protein [Atopobiaceae bacterium]MCH4277117.1 DUF2273 domain-containing protein [Atopobiaceae bacterium]
MAQDSSKKAAGSQGRSPKATVDTEAKAASQAQDAKARKDADAGSQQQGASSRDQGKAARETMERTGHAVTSWFEEMFPGHGNAVLFALIGLLAAILLFAIGFWQTLLVVILVVAGVAFGQYLDGDPTIINWFKGLADGGTKSNRK